ncbi:ABC transporter permease [Deinococcus radiodurans]|nr:ABC transporter permease [Deinococcus radiodurans]
MLQDGARELRAGARPASSVTGTFAPFGTVNGYNIFYGLIWGTRTALKMSFIIVGITLSIGILIGAISGFYGGWVDGLIQGIINVIYALPPLVLTVTILTILRAKNPGGDPTGPIIFAMCITGWATYARVIRGDILKTRQLEYVDAARALGARDMRMILRHVVPNSLTTVFTLAVLALATVPLSVAALSFLGLGFESGYSEWGQLIDFARAWLKPTTGTCWRSRPSLSCCSASPSTCSATACATRSTPRRAEDWEPKLQAS